MPESKECAFICSDITWLKHCRKKGMKLSETLSRPQLSDKTPEMDGLECIHMLNFVCGVVWDWPLHCNPLVRLNLPGALTVEPSLILAAASSSQPVFDLQSLPKRSDWPRYRIFWWVLGWATGAKSLKSTTASHSSWTALFATQWILEQVKCWVWFTPVATVCSVTMHDL